MVPSQVNRSGETGSQVNREKRKREEEKETVTYAASPSPVLGVVDAPLPHTHPGSFDARDLSFAIVVFSTFGKVFRKFQVFVIFRS